MSSPPAPSGSSGSRDQWLSIELRHLAALSAVAHERSFRGAADTLGYVQSAVSQQIAFLERLVGQRLVERSRGPKPVSLTEAGTVLLGHIHDILGQLHTAQADLDALSEGLAGTLRVGVYQSAAARIMPSLLTSFGRRCPGVELMTRETMTDSALFDLVEAGSLDVAFCEMPVKDGPFESEALGEDPYVLVVAARTRLARLKRITSARQLESVSLIGYNAGRAMTRIEDELRQHGVEPSFIFRADITSTAQALAASGTGAAILPRLSVDADDPAIAIVQLGRLLSPRRMGLFWHRDRVPGPGLQALRDIAQEVCTELDPANVVQLAR
jgi:DNA-binding transcriptional LysR family regulator